MSFIQLSRKISLVFLCAAVFAVAGVYAQEEKAAPEKIAKTETTDKDSKPKKGKSKKNSASDSKAETSPDAAPTPETSALTDDDKNARSESDSEEAAAILPYYNNYLHEYHLGPEDVISVEVFGQPNYSKAGITVPPTAKIGYPLIPGGVFVGGKTTDQVADEIKKKLGEYIIDPEVTVTLEKVGSAQFSVLGKVGTPGVRLMNRRYNVYEAVIEAGGIAKDGDSNRVMLIRHSKEGGFTRTVINFKELLSGKNEIPYLVPGDQIIVPEKKWSLTKIFDIVGKASAFRILFGVPF